MTKIRLWTIGILKEDYTNSILPTVEATRKLREQLNDVNDDGEVDVIWGPELSVRVIE
uniref:Uncharacterized protein n=1 Tax=viral metagenome TaxID=1070528 RepID=A0A6M3IQB6_9ZZZZ